MKKLTELHVVLNRTERACVAFNFRNNSNLTETYTTTDRQTDGQTDKALVELTMWGSLRLALAVYTRSPSAYEALPSFKLLQLPSVSVLKSYTTSNRMAPGEIEARLQIERSKYDQRIQGHNKAQKVQLVMVYLSLMRSRLRLAFTGILGMIL